MSVEIIRNGSFETGDLSDWVSGCAEIKDSNNIPGFDAAHGHYFVGLAAGCFIRQLFDPPLKTTSGLSFSHTSAGFVNYWVGIKYWDGTEDKWGPGGSAGPNWTRVTVNPNPDKWVSEIWFAGAEGLGGGFSIDWVTMQGPEDGGGVPPQGSIASCDAGGNDKNSFRVNEDVYAKGTGYLPSTAYDIYLVEHPPTWTDGMSIPTRREGTLTSISTDKTGKFPPTLLWSNPLEGGRYDILVDFNSNGLYDVSLDKLSNLAVIIPTTTPFEVKVIPRISYVRVGATINLKIEVTAQVGFSDRVLLEGRIIETPNILSISSFTIGTVGPIYPSRINTNITIPDDFSRKFRGKYVGIIFGISNHYVAEARFVIIVKGRWRF
jgi:hypothetical protein